MMRTFFLLLTLLGLLLPLSLSAQESTVRVLFYTGNVMVKSGKGSQKAAIGQLLGARDEVTIPKGGTLQLSVNGKVIKYTQPAKVKVGDAVKRAGSGENAAIANTARTLAAASGADRSRRSSQAGATRATDSSTLIAKGKKKVKKEIKDAANDELRERTGIDDPLGKAEQAAKLIIGEDDMIILEPRSTAVTSAPVRFRWLRSPTAGGYIVSVKNYLGEEIFRKETADTTILWEEPKLLPDVIYSWTLIDASNTLHNSGALFHRLSDSANTYVREGAQAIERELGTDNPALPLVLGAFYADNGCFGEAARHFTIGALTSRQHYDEMMRRACDQYQHSIYMQEPEVRSVYSGF